MDLSAWWVLGAFIVGGYAGALLVALIMMAAADNGGSASEQLEGNAGVGPKGAGGTRISW